jgi:hypothetical protein
MTRNHAMNGSQYVSSAFAQHTDSTRVASREGNSNLDERLRNLEFSFQQIESKHGDRIISLEEAYVKDLNCRLKELESRFRIIDDRPVVNVGTSRTLITSPRQETFPSTPQQPEEFRSSSATQPVSPNSISFQAPEQKNVVLSSAESAHYSELRVELDLVQKKLDALERFQPRGVSVAPRNTTSAGSTTVGGLDTERGAPSMSNEDIPDESGLEGMQLGDVERIQAGFHEMVRVSEEGVREDFEKVVAVVQALQKDVKQFAERTDGVIIRLKKVEQERALMPAHSSSIAGATTLATAQGLGNIGGQDSEQN